MSYCSTSEKILTTLAVASLLGVANSSTAANFSVKEQNVVNMGYAYSGTASLAEDASTGFYNPAGLINMNYDNVSLSLVGMHEHVKLDIARATGNTGAAATGDMTTKIRSRALLPSLHLGKKIGDSFAIGFNITQPFGLKTDYGQDSAARYLATKTELSTLNYSPSVAYLISEQWSLGIGFDALRAETSVNTNVLTAAGGAVEGFWDNRGKGWGFGYHLGTQWNMSDKTRMGLVYHSSYSLSAAGTSNILNAIAPGSSTLEFSSRIKLPDRLTYSFNHQYSDSWMILSDVEYVHWSKFKTLRLDFSNGTHMESLQRYKNTIRIALGADYKFNQNWNLKAGLAFDVPRQTNRGANDRKNLI